MKNVDKMLADHKRLIESEVFNQAKFVPRAVVQAEAYRLARKAAESYDDKSGVKFSTHLTNQLKKLSRISTQYGATVRIPEGKQFKIHKINQVEANLKAELHREPSLGELAEATGLPIGQISNLLASRKHDIAISNIVREPVFIDNGSDEWVWLVYHDLSDKDKIIFERKTGFGGKGVLNNEEIAKMIGVSASTVSNRVKVITEKIQEGWQG